jgi:hypothetical protein
MRTAVWSGKTAIKNQQDVLTVLEIGQAHWPATEINQLKIWRWSFHLDF